jgi:hypothetical protein
MEIKYKTLHNKIEQLSNTSQNNKTPNTFHKEVKFSPLQALEALRVVRG